MANAGWVIDLVMPDPMPRMFRSVGLLGNEAALGAIMPLGREADWLSGLCCLLKRNGWPLGGGEAKENTLGCWFNVWAKSLLWNMKVLGLPSGCSCWGDKAPGFPAGDCCGCCKGGPCCCSCCDGGCCGTGACGDLTVFLFYIFR